MLFTYELIVNRLIMTSSFSEMLSCSFVNGLDALQLGYNIQLIRAFKFRKNLC